MNTEVPFSSQAQQHVECTLQAANVTAKIESLFQEAFCQYRATKTVNIDYANEYLTRCKESELGILAFFMVDDLLETLNLDATRAVFEAESGFKLKQVRDGDAIKQMYRLAEDVKIFDTVADKTACWYRKRACKIHQCLDMKMVTWKIWSKMNLGEYMLMYKQMFEGFPGDDSRQFYDSTSLHLLLHKCDPNLSAGVMEYTIQKKNKNSHYKNCPTQNLVDNHSSRRRSATRRNTTRIDRLLDGPPKPVNDPCGPHHRPGCLCVIDLTRGKSCEEINRNQKPKLEKQKRHRSTCERFLINRNRILANLPSSRSERARQLEQQQNTLCEEPKRTDRRSKDRSARTPKKYELVQSCPQVEQQKPSKEKKDLRETKHIKRNRSKTCKKHASKDRVPPARVPTPDHLKLHHSNCEFRHYNKIRSTPSRACISDL